MVSIHSFRLTIFTSKDRSFPKTKRSRNNCKDCYKSNHKFNFCISSFHFYSLYSISHISLKIKYALKFYIISSYICLLFFCILIVIFIFLIFMYLQKS
ncbi:hypothetical protein FD39_GL001275 [Lactobacillus amylolyticus DSM 11664]|nr:hypothetical protein FD39_GL001275 [Lactobacillus amylolyticus DSM 11664]